MGWIIAIGIVWFICARCEDPVERKRQRRIHRTIRIASTLWFLDAIVNAEKRNKH